MTRYVHLMVAAPSALRNALQRVLLPLPTAGQAFMFDGTNYGWDTPSSGPSPYDATPEPLGTADPGDSALYSRGNHVHDMPSAADVGADPAGAAATAYSGAVTYAAGLMTTHEGATNPHTQYEKTANKGAANGYASLDSSTKVPVTQLPSATTLAYGVVLLAPSGGLSSGTVVQANDTRLSDSRTPTAHKTSHYTGGSDAIAPANIGAEATANKDVANGYCGLDSGVLVPVARLPAATSAAQGAVRLGTWFEDQTTASNTRVYATTADEFKYFAGRPLWGRMEVSPFHNGPVVGAQGILAPGAAATGTFNSQLDDTSGPYVTFATSTTIGRGVYCGNANAGITWNKMGVVRLRGRFGHTDTFRIYLGLAMYASADTDLSAATSSVAKCIRFGIDNGTVKSLVADGTAVSAESSAWPAISASTLYEFEMVINRSRNKVTFYLYSWSMTTGPVLITSRTITTNIPTGTNPLIPAVWTRAISGTPNAMFAKLEVTMNIADL